MDAPLLYLTLCSMRNRLRVRLRRLREPRYLIGLAVGLLYLYSILGRRRPGARRTSGLEALDRSRIVVELGAAFSLFAAVTVAWLWPGARRPALAFSRADVQLLFTAPIPRRRLVRYKVLRSQVAAVISSAIVTLLFRPPNLAEGWTFFVGVSLVMATLNLHVTGVSLYRSSRASGLPARWAPRVLALVGVSALVATALANSTNLADIAARGGSVLDEIERLGTSGIAGAVLWPFRVVVRPALVESTTAFLIALPGTLAILVLNYIWVLRMDVPFEEASAELSEAIAKAREGRRGIGPRRPRAEAPTPFTLALDGPAETAILWKNLILISRFLSWKVLLRFAPILIFVIAVLAGGGFGGSKAQGLAVICALVGAVALLLGPQMMRSDLRHDLMSLAVLKTWPMRGATLVRGEILAPALVLSSIVAVALILATVLSTPTTQAAPIVGRWPALAAALLIAPGIILMQLLVQNAIAVSFPSWVAIGHQRSTGIDVMGQRLIMLAGSLVALLLAALPAALVAAVTGGIIYGLSGYVPVVLPGILAGLTLLAEAFIGSEIVGSILDHTDVSAIDAPQS